MGEQIKQPEQVPPVGVRGRVRTSRVVVAPGDRPALYVYDGGAWKYAHVMARLDHADSRTEYRVPLQTSRDRGTVHRAYWWPRPGLRHAHGSTSEPADRAPGPERGGSGPFRVGSLERCRHSDTRHSTRPV
ncbi:hypothetical protein [Streptomyces sp. Ac-502]|uniref:hypothetical protein n=1 Tax=Streptomyces sp. Ac-502 TaxID=3342801 RepID=UPI003862CE06